ncbi:transposase [Paraburkholderia sp. JHI869]|uniref:IS110 family transposase n=1 Tax=Paraburkholderia sp. JHI869 TaxID=3112959 RepID=UPI003173E177
MNIVTVGLDLAKSVMQVHAVNSQGEIVVRKTRGCTSDCHARTVCNRHGSVHLVALLGPRAHQARTHVRLIAPQFVRPYVKSNKTDAADAEAICEAITQPNMRFVPLKTQAQLIVLSLHRARAGLVKPRTALANQIRGLLGVTLISVQISGQTHPSQPWVHLLPPDKNRAKSVGCCLPARTRTRQSSL